MLVTALTPKIGYDKAANIAKLAHKNGTTLKEEVIKAGLLKEKEYDKIMDPMKMTKPKQYYKISTINLSIFSLLKVSNKLLVKKNFSKEFLKKFKSFPDAL